MRPVYAALGFWYPPYGCAVISYSDRRNRNLEIPRFPLRQLELSLGFHDLKRLDVLHFTHDGMIVHSRQPAFYRVALTVCRHLSTLQWTEALLE